MSKRRRTLFQNILVVGLGLVMALILLEIGARWLPPPYDSPAEKADVCSDQFGWRGAAQFKVTVATEDYVHDLTLNSAGMHDDDHPQTKPADTHRILMLGDSFVRAHQVRENETAHQLIEDLFNQEAAAPPAEVISAGVDGWGTGQQLLYYRHEGRFYQPDLVLLMVYLGNDVTDNLPGRGVTTGLRNCYAPYFVLHQDRLDSEPWLYAPGLAPAIDQPASGRKVLARILGKIYQTSRLYAQLEPLFAIQQRRVSGLDFYVDNNELFDYSLRLTFALIKQLHQEVRQDEAQFAVVLISPLALIDFARMTTAEREQVYQRLPHMRRAEHLDPPNQVFANTLAQEGIQVLDLFPAFVQHLDETESPLHFQQDKHWNVAGNRLVGQAIYRWLQEQREARLN